MEVFFFYFFIFYLWRPLLMITLYHQTKILISFWWLWTLMWLNWSIVIINVTLQFLDIYTYIYIFIYKYWFHLLNLIYFIVSSKLWKSWFYCGMLMTFHIKFHLTFFFWCISWLKRNILKKILPQVESFLKLLRYILLLVKFYLSKQNFDFQFILGLKQKSKLKL